MKFCSGLSRPLLLITLAASILALSGCGQQGPLYLPDAKMPHGKTAITSKGRTPVLPPPSAAPEPAHTGSDDSTAIVPVTPSIPN